jgi:pimeloyl-ACP methyl ester carboxylesterase
MQGDWSADWCASTCAALLLHGHKSWVLKTQDARAMADQRPNTRLVEFPDSAHAIHDDEPEAFYAVVKEFLDQL